MKSWVGLALLTVGLAWRVHSFQNREEYGDAGADNAGNAASPSYLSGENGASAHSLSLVSGDRLHSENGEQGGDGQSRPVDGVAREWPEFNFRLESPDDDWSAWQNEREGTLLALHRTLQHEPSPHGLGEADFTLRVIPVGEEKQVDRNAAAGLVEAALRSAGTAVEIHGREEVSLNDMKFTRLQVDRLPQGDRLTRAEVWIYEHRGMIYELLTALPEQAPDYFLSQTARRLVSGFHILDPAWSVTASQASALLDTAHASPVAAGELVQGPVSFSAEGGKWRTWPGAANCLPGYAWAVSAGNGLRMAVGFAGVEGLPEDDGRIVSAAGWIWPALRVFDWDPPVYGLHGGHSAARMTGQGIFNNQEGRSEVRVVRLGRMVMMLFAFQPGLAGAPPGATLEHFEIEQPLADPADPGAGVRPGPFDRRILAGLAAESVANGRYEAAAEFHKAMFTRDSLPDDLCNACRCLASAGRLEAAMLYLKQKEPEVLSEPGWRSQKMLLLAGLGRSAASLKVAEELLSSRGVSGSVASIYIETLLQQKAYPEVKAFIGQVAALDESPVWQLYQAVIMAETGQRSRSAQVVQSVQRSRPDDVDLQVECVNMLIRCRLHPEALALAKSLTVRFPRRDQLLLLSAQCHTSLGLIHEAREVYKQILRLSPDCKPAQAALVELSAAAGQSGTDQLVVTRTTPVPLPQAVESALPALADRLPQDSHVAVHLYRVKGVSSQSGRPLRETTRGAIRILDEEGMARMNTMRVPLNPAAQTVCFHHLRVLDEEGHLYREASLRDHYAQEETHDGSATGGKIINIPIPGLKPGCTIEYAYTVESAASTSGLDYTRHLFAQSMPCRKDIWYFTGDSSGMKFASSRGLEPVRDGDSVIFTEEKPGIDASEGDAPAAEGLSILHCGVPGTSWEDLARDYLDRIRGRLSSPAIISRTAAELTAGLRTREEKTSAVSAFVRDSISYTAIEFGARAIMPNDAAQTLANRYGDCKDQSVLMHTLLQAAGVESRLCLINSRHDVLRSFPSLSQFDHMIVAVPSGAGEGYDFIDPTNKYMEATPGAAPIGLQSRGVMILDPVQPVYAVTPANTPPTSIQLKRQIDPGEDAGAAFTETIAITGSRAAALRAQWSPLSAGARQSALRKLFAFDHVNHQVTRLDVEHIKNLKQPLILHISWTAANVIRREEGRRLLELPGIIEAGLLNLSAEQDSGNPAVTTAPAICHSIISISGGGSGFRIENPRSLIPLRSGHGVSHIATLQDKGTQLLEWNCSLLPGSLASGGKASRNAFLRDSLRLMQCDWPISGSPDPAGPVASSIKSN